jgi:hypothetical protein
VNWAYELLGLPLDADVANIKRAYARLLRTTRPDDDPEAFQRLHTAYKTALARANAQPSSKADTAPQQTEVGVTPEPATRSSDALAQPLVQTVNVTLPTIHPATLVNEVIQAAMQAENGSALSGWLEQRPEFWSIQLKQQIGRMLLQQLFQQPQAMPSSCLDALLRFFDLDHVLAGINPVELKRLHRRQKLLWELLPAHHIELTRHVGLVTNERPDIIPLRRDLALLQQPFHWRRMLLPALQIGRARRLARLVQTLVSGGLDELPPSIDRKQALFWLRAAMKRGPMTRERFAVGSLQASAAALLSALCVFGVLALTAPTPGDWLLPGGDAATVGLAILGLWLIYAAGAWFDRWQGMPESAPSRWPWLRRLAIPSLCMLGVAMSLSEPLHAIGAISVFLSLVYAVRRLRHRNAMRSKPTAQIHRIMPMTFFLVLSFSSVVLRTQDAEGSHLLSVAACLALAVWTFDMWQHRAHLHPRFARR